MSFPKLLKSLRKSKKISQEKLGQGLSSSNSFISRIERGEYKTDKMTREFLIGRLGYSVEGFEEYLRPEEAELFHARHQILESLHNRNATGFNRALKLYDHLLPKNHAIAKQFSLMMHAHLKKESGVSSGELHKLYSEAMACTIPSAASVNPGTVLLSISELNILLEYTFTISDARVRKERLRDLISLAQSNHYELLLQSKILPKAVCYYLQSLIKDDDADIWTAESLEICSQTLDILRRTQRSYYLTELLELREYLLERRTKNVCTDVRLLGDMDQNNRWKKAFLEAYHAYDIPTKMTHDAYIYNSTENYSIGHVIRVRRNMFGYTQKELGDLANIGMATVYRAEKDNARTQTDTFRRLFTALNLPAESMMRFVITEDASVFDMLELSKRSFSNGRFAEARKILKQVIQKIPMEERINRQYVDRMECMMDYRQNLIDTDECISRLKKCLELTVPYESIIKGKEIFLSKGELNCLQNLAVVCNRSQKDITPLITVFETHFRNIQDTGLIGIYINLYEFVMSLVESVYGNNQEYKKSDDISHFTIKECLKRYRIGVLERNLYNLYWNKSKTQNVNKRQATDILYRCLALSEFCNNHGQREFYLSKINSFC